MEETKRIRELTTELLKIGAELLTITNKLDGFETSAGGN